MLIMTVWRTRQGLESVEDQVSADVGSVVQAYRSAPYGQASWPAMRSRQYKDLSGEENLTLDRIIVDD